MHFIGMGSIDQCQKLKKECEIDDDYPKITAFRDDKNNREPGELEGHIRYRLLRCRNRRKPQQGTDTAAGVAGGRKSRKNRTLTKRRTLQNRRRYSTNTKGKKMRRRTRHLII
jgi:hypothetical protein